MRSQLIPKRFLVSIFCLSVATQGVATTHELVGHWNFDDQTGNDSSPTSAPMILDGTTFYQLSATNHCLRFDAESKPARIEASSDSPLAVERGTIGLWLNMAWDGENILEYDNQAIQFRVYRRHLQPRFKGEGQFVYGSGLLDYDWPKYDMREWAFYPHVRSAVGDSEWHHFAVAYDDKNKQIKGWRDGEPIATVDLSTLKIEPLRREGLNAIVLGDEFIGFIDDVRIYNRVLTDSEVQSLYENTHSTYTGRSDLIPTDRVMDVYQYKPTDKTLYRAWLQYAPLAKSTIPDTFRQIVAEGSDPTIMNAGTELKQAIEKLFHTEASVSAAPPKGPCIIIGTPDTSPWIKARSHSLNLHQIRFDGYVIRTVTTNNEDKIVIASLTPGGAIQGTFDLIRRLQSDPLGKRYDLLENPQIPIRMVGHWSNFRGFLGDNWRGGRRDNSIYSWEELGQGNTDRIRDWVRLLASAGWNALCPSEVNWSYRNNFLEHLNEVETLARICREFGITLYWSPNYLLALEPDTAKTIYQRVPDFGGYVLKLGSEKQNGDPRPAMVNRIADTLKPFGGHAVVRAFVYGNSRYTPEPFRNLIPYDLFAKEDQNYRDNVILTPKSGPLDWDLSAPIPSLDGAMTNTKSGTEWVIDKSWPVSWVEKWKWWLDQDTYRGGHGNYNKDRIHCVMGVSMISPSPSWTASPLNMVNYYGLGRLAWNPDLSLNEIYRSWIRQTFGDDPEIQNTILSILFLSDDVLRKLYLYRGYRGVWIDRGDDGMVEGKTPHVINPQGIGIRTQALKERLLQQYAPGLRAIYADPLRSEEFLTTFHYRPLEHRLSIGRTLIQDVYANLNEAIELADQLLRLWKRLENKIEPRQFNAMTTALSEFASNSRSDAQRMAAAFQSNTKQDSAKVMEELTKDRLVQANTFNVKQYGAQGEGLTDDTHAIRSALEACHDHRDAILFFPSGIYRSNTLTLRSHMTVALDTGAVLMPLAASMLNANAAARPVLHGNQIEQVSVLGPGTIAGNKQGVGISVTNAKDFNIRNLNIQDFNTALSLDATSQTTLDHIRVSSCQTGIQFNKPQQLVIRHSQISSILREEGKPVGGGAPILHAGKRSPKGDLPIQVNVDNCVLSATAPFPDQFKHFRLQDTKILQTFIEPLAPNQTR